MYKWTREQKEELLKIADACKEDNSLAPLWAAIYISTEPLTEEDIEAGKRLSMKFDKEEVKVDKNWRPDKGWENPYKQAVEVRKAAMVESEPWANVSLALDEELAEAFEEGASAIIPSVRAETLREVGDMIDRLICSANEKGEVGVVTWLCALRTDITLLRGEMPEERK